MIRANRKRYRNIEEESSEFMPLSKRINNLHINSLSGLPENRPTGVVESRVESMETDWESGNFMSSPSCSQNSSPRGSCGSSQSNFTNDYRPDLDATENPFYYESNKLLFSLYMERMQRRLDLY
ncbi:hypothetical protein CAJAP_04728 [Camponotus japonicus]